MQIWQCLSLIVTYQQCLVETIPIPSLWFYLSCYVYSLREDNKIVLLIILILIVSKRIKIIFNLVLKNKISSIDFLIKLIFCFVLFTYSKIILPITRKIFKTNTKAKLHKWCNTTCCNICILIVIKMKIIPFKVEKHSQFIVMNTHTLHHRFLRTGPLPPPPPIY